MILDCRICEARPQPEKPLSADGLCAACCAQPALMSAFREGLERVAGREPLRAVLEMPE